MLRLPRRGERNAILNRPQEVMKNAPIQDAGKWLRFYADDCSHEPTAGSICGRTEVSTREGEKVLAVISRFHEKKKNSTHTHEGVDRNDFISPPRPHQNR